MLEKFWAADVLIIFERFVTECVSLYDTFYLGTMSEKDVLKENSAAVIKQIIQ